WFYRRDRFHLLMLVAAYAGASAGFLLQHFTLPFGLPVTRLFSNIFFTLAVLCLSSAIISRFGRRVPWTAVGLLGAGGLAAFCWFLFVQPDLTWRVLAMNFAFGGITLIVAAELGGAPGKGPVERVLIALALLSGANFIVRTL